MHRTKRSYFRDHNLYLQQKFLEKLLHKVLCLSFHERRQLWEILTESLWQPEKLCLLKLSSAISKLKLTRCDEQKSCALSFYISNYIFKKVIKSGRNGLPNRKLEALQLIRELLNSLTHNFSDRRMIIVRPALK